METQTALIRSAQAGDRIAFDTLVESHRRELLVHCYRMLGEQIAHMITFLELSSLLPFALPETLLSPEKDQ